MRYIALLIGRGEGCDYTIGCNQTWITLKADTMQKAIEECKVYDDDEDGRTIVDYHTRENELELATIIEVSDEVDFLKIHDKLEEEREAQEAEEEEKLNKEERRELYEDLREEFEND